MKTQDNVKNLLLLPMPMLLMAPLAVGLVVALSGVASASLITGLVRANGQSGNRLPIGMFDGNTHPLATEPGGLKDENLVFSDRIYPWAYTPVELIGAEYIRMFNTDKNPGETDVTYTVTISKPCTVAITVDDRIPAEWNGGGTILSQQDAVDRVVAAFAAPGTFQDTDLTVYIRESDTMDRPMSVFAAVLPAGTYVFGPQPSGKNFYTIAAIPATIAFEDHFVHEIVIGPEWNTYFPTDDWYAYEKQSDKYGSILVMFADGTDIWTDNDEYGAVYMSVEGDFDAIVQVEYQQPTDPWAKAGLAIRNDMAQPGSPEGPGSLGYAGIFVTPGNGYAFHWDAGGPGGCGTSVSALRANPNYPDHPDGSESITSFAGPIDWADCYGQRIWGLIQPPAAADLIVAEELLVDLRAEDLSFGSAVTTWPNRGTLGAFTAFGTPVVETVGGMKCVTFDGSSWFTGPASIPGIEGAGTRSMEVWAYNPSMPGEETLLSWAHRGGPEGSNMAFNYGNDSRWGAVGHWGGDTHDIGWWGSHSPAPAANTWWHLAYTYDGTAARVYVDGAEESVRDPIALNTHGGTPVRVAAQADETGEGVDGTFNFTGSIAEVRIHDGVLTQEEILNNSKLGYFFRIASDDNSELWLSTDDNPANAQLIAEVPGWTPPDEYGWYPSQRSGPIVLDPSKKYYIEALHKEGGGGDHLTVQWSGPGFDWQTIQGEFLREWWTTGWGPDGFLDSNVNEGGASYPCWLKLEKRGTSFSGYYSTSGRYGPWTCVGGATLDNAETIQDVGMIATSHSWGKVGSNAFHYFALLDAGAPDFQFQVTPTVLWPPNHQMVEITPFWTVQDGFDPSPVVSLESITMNEGDETSTYDPTQQTKGDGNTAGDIYVDAKGRIFLRAERSGTGTARIYTITYQAADFCGNVTERSATVTVPHDQR